MSAMSAQVAHLQQKLNAVFYHVGLQPSELRMKGRANLQGRADPAPYHGPAARGLGDAAEYLEERALVYAVPADDAQHLAAPDLEGNIAQRPKVIR